MTDKQNDTTGCIVDSLAIFGRVSAYAKTFIVCIISLFFIYIGIYTIHVQTKYIDSTLGTIVKKYCNDIKIRSNTYKICDYVVKYTPDGSNKTYYGFIPDQQSDLIVGDTISLKYRPCVPNDVVAENSLPQWNTGSFFLSAGFGLSAIMFIYVYVVNKHKIFASAFGATDIASIMAHL